jgi:hypothetical protein
VPQGVRLGELPFLNQPSLFAGRTVCAVAADPDFFDGRVVTVPAVFESDGFQYSSLAGPACAGSIISVISGPTDDNACRVLSKAVSKGRRGTSDKDIRGSFTGTFRWSPKEAPACTIELQTASQDGKAED